jgi:hypothetical protein
MAEAALLCVDSHLDANYMGKNDEIIVTNFECLPAEHWN